QRGRRSHRAVSRAPAEAAWHKGDAHCHGRADGQRPRVHRRGDDAQGDGRAERSIVNPVIPQSYQPLMLGLMVLSGLIAWAAGYRLFRLVLTLNGFIFGAWVTTAMFGASDRTVLVFAALAGGAVGALIMFFGYFVGVALVGA